jgi:hypothetical protein
VSIYTVSSAILFPSCFTANTAMLDKSQWIGVQKKWASVPSWLKKLAAEYFLIPQELEADLIPSPYLCIAELLAFPFPLQNAAGIALQPAQSFSPIALDIGDSELMLRVRRLPIPDSKTIHKLIASSRQSWLDGAQSVIYSHVGGSVTHFPPWILTYWAAVDEIKKVWGRLRASQAWVTDPWAGSSRPLKTSGMPTSS